MPKDTLYEIIDELNKYKRNKEYLEMYYVQKRLDKTLERYYESLTKTFNVLYNNDIKDVLNNLKGE